METSTIKALFDACYLAKRSRDLMPPLPRGVTPSYIHLLDAIDALERGGQRATASDISDALHLPRPGVTRTVKAMEGKGYLCRRPSARDGRVAFITATPAGQELLRRYTRQYFARLAPLLGNISEEDAACTIRTLGRLYRVMSEGRITIE